MTALLVFSIAIADRSLLLGVIGVLALIVAYLMFRMPELAGAQERLLLAALRRYTASGNHDEAAFVEAVEALRALVTWPHLIPSKSVEQAHRAGGQKVD